MARTFLHGVESWILHINFWIFLGSCQGDCACSTCHVIVESEHHYDSMAPLTEREEDMLDLAAGLTRTSRLGCQVHLTAALDGVEIKLPGILQEI